MGPIERAVRADVGALGELMGTDSTLAELAYRVAQEIDNGASEGRQMAALSRELRLSLHQLADGHAGGADDFLGDLGAPD